VPERELSLAETLARKLDYDQLVNCMRCGFCLPACPTFGETGLEQESPRGRIAQMKAVADGLMMPDDAFRTQMDHCLGCRACETVCPAGVQYGRLIEQAREAIAEHPVYPVRVKVIRNLTFRRLFPHPKRLNRLGGLVRFYQTSGLQRAARKSGALRLLPEHLQAMEAVMPDASGQGVVGLAGEFHPARGEPIARVGLFRGCIMDVLFARTNVNTVNLLTAAGFDVVIPDAQNCCGALQAHGGETEIARDLARKNIRAFKEAGVDFIVTNAGGCGALLAEYDQLLEEDGAIREDAAWFAERVVDVSRLIVERGRIPVFREKERRKVRITYQDSCHLRNVMKSGAYPRTLLRRVENAEFVEMAEADRCCGSAGIYNLTQPEMSGRILKRKMEHANRTKADYLLTSNPGCWLQMKHGTRQHPGESPMEVMHIVDYLWERIAEMP